MTARLGDLRCLSCGHDPDSYNPVCGCDHDVIDRALNRIDASGDCWEWTGTRAADGYGVISVGGRQWKAHRIMWEMLVGPIPDGLVIDHLCRNVLCVNPDHLDPTTIRENTLRGYSPAKQNSAKRACKRGHVFTDENTMRRPTGRRCRECHRADSRESMRRYRAKEAARAAN